MILIYEFVRVLHVSLGEKTAIKRNCAPTYSTATAATATTIVIAMLEKEIKGLY